ncbi:MAG: hypothetical protein IJI37_05530 [Opitutales bacterium]|nr:hypothetical protein [Opitutales bacterium]
MNEWTKTACAFSALKTLRLATVFLRAAGVAFNFNELFSELQKTLLENIDLLPDRLADEARKDLTSML